MRQHTLFTKTRRESPKDEVSHNAELLTRGGFIHKEMAGVYSFLPLGLRVLNNIAEVIRQEMNRLGGQEVHLSVLQNPELWETTGRWSDDVVDVWFKTKLGDGVPVGLGPTHEEPLTALLKNHIVSWRDLPLAIYQIQTKFRNEVRSKGGLLRGREFDMKDLYSFSVDQKQHEEFYEKAKEAYMHVFRRVGLGDRTYITFASGGMFSKYSHEFQTRCAAGEDVIYVDEENKRAVNKEVYTDEVLTDMKLTREQLKETRAIEVGNIFTLGTRFSDALGLTFKNESGELLSPFMGCYGIGLNRLMGTIVEVLSDDKGIVWPSSVAPFHFHLLDLSGGDGEVRAAAEGLYRRLSEKGFSVLFDDREVHAGEKFADADLLGIPFRLVVSGKTLSVGKIEITKRENGETKLVDEAALPDYTGGL